MSKFNVSVVTAVTALFVSSGAMAATIQPVAGQGPYFSQSVAMNGMTTRASVEAQAATWKPAAGQHSAWSPAKTPDDPWTRDAVEAQAAAHRPIAGQMTSE